MTILRRGLIVLLLIANIVLLIYFVNGIKEPPQEIIAENVTLVAAPDQTEAEIHPAFIKEEFVLTLPEGENIAVDKKIKDNGFTDVYGANRANDGKADGASYWEGKGYPSIITIDLEEPANIHAVRVVLNPLSIWGKRTQTIAVNISSDGESFTELVKTKQYTFDPDEGNQVQIPFDETETRFVQLVITENSGAGGGQVAEFEIYSK
ncbi:MAG: discoidin domain-containing protein [Anaerolineaceae bacterium]|nr:MAG: discoidin domain-containing protein [Anaerolineaceae bacterium]